MAFKKKGAPSASSLDLSMNDQACSGVSPVNKQGQVTDKSGQEVDWPMPAAAGNVPTTKPSAPTLG